MPEATFSVSACALLDEIIPPCVSSSVTVEGRSGWVVDDREHCDLLEGPGPVVQRIRVQAPTLQ